MAVGQRRLAAIMFTDMVDYTALTQANEAEALTVLEVHHRLLRPIFPRFQGREIKTAGDSFLVEFESALDAARCAVEIQRVLHEHNLTAEGSQRIRVRIGVHVGDVVRSNGDVLGDAVNIASRVESVAPPEGICLTQQVYDQIQNKISNPIVRLPATPLKNVRLPVAIYRVLQPWDDPRGGFVGGDRSGGHHLAVLPLANISPDPGDEYFADGLTEELISVLSQVRGLSVIARTSVAPYKLAPRSVAQVGVDLGVDSVLEGSVRKAGNQIRITLQLIDVATQGHVWATSYNREFNDVFAIQADIAARTAEALRLELAKSGPSADRGRPTPDIAAYDQYLRGLAAARRPKGEGNTEALRSFERATQLDPTFADAFAAWANFLVIAAGDSLPMAQVMPRARELAARALELDPDSSDAHSSLGNIAFQFDQDWTLAEAEFRRAIALNASNVTAHRFLALMLIALDRLAESKDEQRRAMQLDPSASDGFQLAWAEYLDGNYETALSYLDHSQHGESSSAAARLRRGWFYGTIGRSDDALKEVDFDVSGEDDEVQFDAALLRAVLGRPEAARARLAELEHAEPPSYTSGTHRAMLLASVGESKRALDLLEKDFREGERVLWLYYRGPWFDSIRDDARFLALLRQYGVPLNYRRGPRASKSPTV